MAIACLLGRHAIVDRGVRNGSWEFARCDRCRCDLMRKQARSWQRVPRGFKVVWKPKAAGGVEPAGAAAFGRQVDLRGVTVVGERTYGAQRFALVVLNAQDERDYSAMVDPLGMDGPVAARVARPSLSRQRPEAPRQESVFDMIAKSGTVAGGGGRQSAPRQFHSQAATIRGKAG